MHPIAVKPSTQGAVRQDLWTPSSLPIQAQGRASPAGHSGFCGRGPGLELLPAQQSPQRCPHALADAAALAQLPVLLLACASSAAAAMDMTRASPSMGASAGQAQASSSTGSCAIDFRDPDLLAEACCAEATGLHQQHAYWAAALCSACCIMQCCCVTVPVKWKGRLFEHFA